MKTAVLMIVILATVAFAGDASGKVQMIFPCHDDRFEFQIIGKTALWQTVNKPIRYICNRSSLGPERFKETFAMLLTAITADLSIWCATGQAAGTYLTNGNCGGGDCPAQEVFGLSINK